MDATMSKEATMYNKILRELQSAYDRAAPEREAKEKARWKELQRDRFRKAMDAEGFQLLLELGAGTGADAEFFQTQGFRVVCGDLSLINARYCKTKGLQACVLDLSRPCFQPESFESVYSMNCLLHVPKVLLPSALSSIHRVLVPNGLFYMGQYGGNSFEGVVQEDHYHPKRFYSLHSDAELVDLVSAVFDVLEFQRILLPDEPDYHYQALLLRRR